MKRILLYILVLPLFTACLEDEDIQNKIVAFDEAFVPVWYYAYTNQPEEVAQAVFYLDQAWAALRADYQDVVGYQSDWEETYNCVNDFIRGVVQAAEYHEVNTVLLDMEYIKFELMQLRARYEVDYYLDNVWAFQMDYALVKELTETGYYFREWNEFDCLINEMNESWILLQEAVLLQDWLADNIAALTSFKQDLGVAVQDFNTQYKSINIESDDMVLNADAIERPLLSLIQLFGDFDPKAVVGTLE